MKVIAIRDSYFNDGVKPTHKAIHKGAIYHVTAKHFNPEDVYFYDVGVRYPDGVHLYELLEQIGTHVADMFLELPEELFENVETKQETEAI
jgi:hypothetical protein